MTLQSALQLLSATVLFWHLLKGAMVLTDIHLNFLKCN